MAPRGGEDSESEEGSLETINEAALSKLEALQRNFSEFYENGDGGVEVVGKGVRVCLCLCVSLCLCSCLCLCLCLCLCMISHSRHHRHIHVSQ